MGKSYIPPPLPKKWSRREFLHAAAAGGAGAALAACVTNPVTGKSQFMLVSQDEEIRLDQSNAPQQFSEDYGVMQDTSVNAYLSTVGGEMSAITHRPNMPYSFRGVNASHINAYAFPGGTIACTRGILLKLDNEAQLAGLLGHELGHVNARHCAARMSKGILLQLAVTGATLYVAHKNEDYAPIAAAIGGLGTGLLLARYSRADERQADALGMQYMVKREYNPEGMAGLMEILVAEQKERPDALSLMFATHPMSEERLETARREAQNTYAAAGGYPLQRERYQDHIAPLRRYKPLVEAIQRGDHALAQKNPTEAEGQYAAALRFVSSDYEALLKMSKCLVAQGRSAEAARYAERAKIAQPGEPQAFAVAGMSAFEMQRFDVAHDNFSAYQRALPGAANLYFLDGFCLDRLGRRSEAAEAYGRYLNTGAQDPAAGFAAQRLQTWQQGGR